MLEEQKDKDERGQTPDHGVKGQEGREQEHPGPQPDSISWPGRGMMRMLHASHRSDKGEEEPKRDPPTAPQHEAMIAV